MSASMNLNTNMNLNNVLSSQITGTVPINNQRQGMDKSDFLKMLKAMMFENKNLAQLPQSENAGLNPDILMLLQGNSGLVKRNAMDDAITDEMDGNTQNAAEFDKRNAADRISDDLYGMSGLFNNAVPNIMGPETSTGDIINGIPESGYFQSYNGMPNFNQFQNIWQADGGSKNQEIGAGTQTQTQTQEVSESPVNTASVGQNFSAEKLIAEIEENRSRLRNDIDFKANLLMASSKSVQEENNHTITVSDEATQIKPQILSQVAGKIAYIAEEKPGESGEVKYVTMELQPHNLGKVDIKMAFEGDKLTVEVKALNKETQKILQSNADELANILNKATKTAVDIVVKVNDNQYENHVVSNSHNNQQQEQQNYNQNNDDARQQGRNKEGYYHSNKDSDKEDEDIFSQMINLRNIKLSM